MVRLRDSGGKRYLKCLNSYGVLRIVSKNCVCFTQDFGKLAIPAPPASNLVCKICSCYTHIGNIGYAISVINLVPLQFLIFLF